MDEATNVKAGWLRVFARGSDNSPLGDPIEVANLLATVNCSYSVPLLHCLPPRCLPKQALLI